MQVFIGDLNGGLDVPAGARTQQWVPFPGTEATPGLEPFFLSSTEGAKTIQNFVVRNLEFDDLDVFLDNVVAYDPFRSRTHIERTVRYNVLQRADGTYISKDLVGYIDSTYRTEASGFA